MEDNIIDKDYKKKNILFISVGCLLSFAIPFALMVIVFATNGFSPFTKNGLTLSSIDFQSQYISYLKTYRQILLGKQSLVYTQAKVFGGDFMSIFTYYLASPFNLLLAFFSDSSIPEYMLFISIIKMSFASMNFYLLCKHLYKDHKIGNLIFAISYGLISYSVIYISNYMWLDGVMILPLVILGLYYIKENKRLWLYPLAVFYAMMTSWYIGFMICVFILLFFLYLFFSMEEKMKVRLPFLYRFLVFSFIGGMLASVFWVTAFLHFSGTKATQSLPNFIFFSLSTFFSGFLENNYPSIRMIQQNQGYVSMFTGVVSLVFALRYFLNKSYGRKERLASLILVFVFFLLASNSVLNALYHGGRTPSWFPARYSFEIGFLTCFLASREFAAYKESPKYSFALPLVVAAVVLPIVIYTKNSSTFSGSEQYQNYSFSLPSFLIYFIASLLSGIYPLIKDYDLIKKKSIVFESSFAVAFLGLSCYSSYRGYNKIVETNATSNQYQSKDKYLEDLTYTPVFDTIKEYDSSDTYRMEALFNRPGNYNEINNNPLFYSYNGLNHYSSNEKKTVEDYFLKLGFQYNYYFEKYDGGSTASINSLFNMKYLIDMGQTTTNNPIFYKNTNSLNPWKKLDLETSVDNVTYYENTKAISYGFVIDDSSSTYVSEGKRKENGNVYWYDHFEYQNEMFKSMVSSVKDAEGNKKDIFKAIPLTLKAETGYTYTIDEDGFYHFTAEKGTTITFTFQVPNEASGNNLYFNVKDYDSKIYSYLDSKKYDNSSYWHKGIRGFEDNSTHLHSLRFYLTEDVKDKLIRPEVYYEDLSVLNEYLDVLSSSMLKDVKQNKSLIKYGYSGTINISSENKDKTLIFTFPKETGISIKIDGKKQKLVTRLNIFAAVDFSGLSEGEHKVEIVYRDIGLALGSAISLIFAVVFILSLIYYPKFEKKFIIKDNA